MLSKSRVFPELNAVNAGDKLSANYITNGGALHFNFPAVTLKKLNEFSIQDSAMGTDKHMLYIFVYLRPIAFTKIVLAALYVNMK